MRRCTIVIPTHNRDTLLERAVHSALAACPADGEVLVVDDKSIVPAAQVLAHLQDARLRVVVNTGATGAANTRNLGVSLAAGEVVFFLDDDDEIVADYCHRVLAPAGPSSMAEWGFSSTVQRRVGAEVQDTLRVRRRLCRDVASAASKPRDLVAAMSDGLWIHRRVMQLIGGLDPQLSIDEDTDLCVRLLAAHSLPWYEVDPGTIVYRGYVPSRAEGAQLTVATPAQRGLECYWRSYEKNEGKFGGYSAMRWFLATRFLRRAVKAGESAMAKELVRSLNPPLFRVFALGFLNLKRLVHANRLFSRHD